MRRRFLFAALAFVLAAGAFLFVNREPLILDAMASKLPRANISVREALIEPYLRFYPPANAEPPYPAVIQFHGCSGVRPPFMEQWAKIANEAGYMAVVADSNSPRGIGRERALASVCAGKELIGQERAGDILAAYEIVRRRSDVDPSKIVLAGWSHGGWSVMDFIAMDPPKRLPAGIAREGVEPAAVAGIILVYPYCGRGAWSRAAGWSRAVPTLALIAGDDHVVDPKECPRVISQLNRHEAGIEMTIFDGKDHVFDDPFLAPEDQHLYNAEAHAEAARLYRAFLDRIAAKG